MTEATPPQGSHVLGHLAAAARNTTELLDLLLPAGLAEDDRGGQGGPASSVHDLDERNNNTDDRRGRDGGGSR